MPINPDIALQVRTPQVENPLDAYGKALQLKTLIGQQQLIPGQIQAQQQENAMRGLQLKNLQDVQAAYASASNPDGTFDMDKLKGVLGTTPGGLDALGHITTFEKGQADLLDAQGKVDLQHRNNGGSIAAAVGAIKDPLAAANTFLMMTQNGIQRKTIDPNTVAPYRDAVQSALQKDPTGAAVAPVLEQIVGQLKQNSPEQQTTALKERETAASEGQLAIAKTREAREQATQDATLPGTQADARKKQMEVAAQELSGVTDQKSYDAWMFRNKVMQDQAPPLYSPASVARLQRAAVPIEKQPEFDLNTMKARMGIMGNSEYDQFLAQYAKGLGKTPAELTPKEGIESFAKFAELKQDPVMRANAIAQGNLANALKQMTLDQMPTKEDAAMLADDIRNHRLAPDQLSQIRGRGNGQLGLMIERELKRTDPQFNWEEASAGYQLSKSPGFQNTVRYMDSVQNSIPQLQQAADALANGNVRSVNALVNAGKNQFNNIDLKKFQADRALVGDEIAKILQGGGTGSGTSDAKLKQAQDLISQTDSPAAIAATLKEVNKLIGYRRDSLTKGTYLESQPAGNNQAQPGSNQPIAEGTVIRLGSKAQYDALPRGAQYIDSDGKTYTKK